MNDRAFTAIRAMDVGGTHVTVAHVEVSSEGIQTTEVRQAPLDSAANAEAIVATLADCASLLSVGTDGPWAVAMPGPFDYAEGVGLFEGVGKFDNLYGIDVRASLLDAVPGATTFDFINDADAFLYGEWQAGAACGYRNAVGITLGTGVGSSFLRDGTILDHGPEVPPQGRADLIIHDGRPLEETVSRRAIRLAYGRETQWARGSVPDVGDIAMRAKQREPAATAVLSRAFFGLGCALAPWLDSFEAEALVVGGSIARSYDLIADPLMAGIAGSALSIAGRIRIRPALHLAEAPLLGAAYWAARRQSARARGLSFQ